MNFTEQQIQKAIKRTYPSYINNLRDRNTALKKDCFIRGTLAEIFFKDLFQQYGFIMQSNVTNNGEDIDLQISGIILLHQTILFDNPLNIEIKTSLIPYQGFDILKSADLKIYQKSNNIECDINWHIGIQVYFNKFKKDWENFIEQSDNTAICNGYKNLNFSCSWITRDRTIEYLNSIPINNRTWSFQGSYKTFWHCPLNIHNHNIYEMIIHLLHLLIHQQQIHINNLNTYITQIKGGNV